LSPTYRIFPIGVVRKEAQRTVIAVHEPYRDGLLGLDGFSHLVVLWWFHQNDTPERRATLRVHPRKNPANPLTGVFATHSPRRPNLVALSYCRIAAVTDGQVEVDTIDAFDGSPVIDLKPHIPVDDLDPGGVRVPSWV
jgi:tRNA-Thr(GGU) m(6)t(6)A37 methyltransferase TsaA